MKNKNCINSHSTMLLSQKFDKLFIEFMQWGLWNNSLNWRKVLKCLNLFDSIDI